MLRYQAIGTCLALHSMLTNNGRVSPRLARALLLAWRVCTVGLQFLALHCCAADPHAPHGTFARLGSCSSLSTPHELLVTVSSPSVTVLVGYIYTYIHERDSGYLLRT